MQRISIIGGGLVGSVLAMFLNRRGHRVKVFERHPDLRADASGSGRSINLTLCERGLVPLARLGIRDRVEALGTPAYGRIMHAADGCLSSQPYGNRGEALYSVPRNALNAALLTLAETRFGVCFEFGKQCCGIDVEQAEATFRDLATGEVTREPADLVFGADGAYSTVRSELEKRLPFDLCLDHLDQVYKELSVPAAADGSWALDPNALHIWPRGHYMLIGFANPDGSFTLALHLPLEGEPSTASVRTEADLLHLFESSFGDALPLLPDLAAQYFERPEASMVTVRCHPWIFADKLALIGDAAHAILPSYGQGANAGFEDCAVLDACLDAAGEAWGPALAEFQRRRKPNADAIAELALEHFHELRDQVGQSRFLLRKRIERCLNERFPDRFSPLYNRVSFTSTPYAEAIEIDRRQRPLIDRLLALEGIEEMVERGRFDEQTEELLHGSSS